MRCHAHVVAAVPRLRLAEADAAELRVGEDRRRQNRVVGRARSIPEHVFHGDACLVLGGRREPGPGRDVAGRPDAAHGGPLTTVDDDPATADLDADGTESKLLYVR